MGGAESQPTAEDWSPSSLDLILADVEAGRIDAATGLLYRVFASFGDDRLPAQYSSTQPVDIDEAAVDEAAYRLDKGDLPANIADELRPYLLRPTNPLSAFYGAPAPTAWRSISAVPALFVAQDQPACGANGWASLKSGTQPVKVWVRCDDPRLGGILADGLAAAETLYSEESDNEMMGPAILDTGELLTDKGKDAGGDNSIDIYFTSRLTCVGRGSDCTTLASLHAGGMAPAAAPYANFPAYTSSAYIVIDRARGDSKTKLWDTMAHEMFHVLQDAHNDGGRLEGGRYHWFTEASATWAEQYFVPDGRATETYPWFNRFQTASAGLTSSDGGNEYASFVWPYFIEGEKGWTTIGTIWKQFEGKMGWEALNAAMAGVFSFEDHFKDFAARALNSKLQPGDPAEPEMQVPDSSFPQTAPEGSYSPTDDKKQLILGELDIRDQGDPLVVPIKVPPLAIRYHVMGIADSVAKLVVDFSGVEPSQAMDVEALAFIHDKGWERRSLSDGKTTFCRDRPEDQVDGLVLVVANHSWADAEALTGSYSLSPLMQPCSDGTYSIDLTGDVAGAGHYDGEGDVECTQVAGTWLIVLVDEGARPPVLGFDISGPGAVSESGGIEVMLRDIQLENGGPWAYELANQSTTVKLDDSVTPAKFTSLATDGNITIKIDGTCAHVTEEETPPPPP